MKHISNYKYFYNLDLANINTHLVTVMDTFLQSDVNQSSSLEQVRDRRYHVD